MKELEEINKKASEILDDDYRGLKQTSNTNKSRYGILGLIEEAYQLGLTQQQIKHINEKIEIYDSIRKCGGIISIDMLDNVIMDLEELREDLQNQKSKLESQ